ncbi:hypothetical protein Emed_007500 [Eimeria media]
MANKTQGEQQGKGQRPATEAGQPAGQREPGSAEASPKARGSPAQRKEEAPPGQIQPGHFRMSDLKFVTEAKKVLADPQTQAILRHKELIYLHRRLNALCAVRTDMWKVLRRRMKPPAGEAWASPPPELVEAAKKGYQEFPSAEKLCEAWPAPFRKAGRTWDLTYVTEFPEVIFGRHWGRPSWNEFLTPFSRDFLAAPSEAMQQEKKWEPRPNYRRFVPHTGNMVVDVKEAIKALGGRVEVDSPSVDEEQATPQREVAGGGKAGSSSGTHKRPAKGEGSSSQSSSAASRAKRLRRTSEPRSPSPRRREQESPERVTPPSRVLPGAPVVITPSDLPQPSLRSTPISDLIATMAQSWRSERELALRHQKQAQVLRDHAEQLHQELGRGADRCKLMMEQAEALRRSWETARGEVFRAAREEALRRVAAEGEAREEKLRAERDRANYDLWEMKRPGPDSRGGSPPANGGPPQEGEQRRARTRVTSRLLAPLPSGHPIVPPTVDPQAVLSELMGPLDLTGRLTSGESLGDLPAGAHERLVSSTCDVAPEARSSADMPSAPERSAAGSVGERRRAVPSEEEEGSGSVLESEGVRPRESSGLESEGAPLALKVRRLRTVSPMSLGKGKMGRLRFPTTVLEATSYEDRTRPSDAGAEDIESPPPPGGDVDRGTGPRRDDD